MKRIIFGLVPLIILILLLGCNVASPVLIEPSPTIENRSSIESVQEEENAACPPFYSKAERILKLDHPPDIIGMASEDFNNDGLSDVIITRMFDSQMEPAEIVFLLNDGNGGLYHGNQELFADSAPGTILSREIVVSDFNGDDRSDVFIADHGLDAPPGPGAKNTLILSTINNKMEDSSYNWRNINDFTHCAAAADIDGDGDIDLYVGNIWGETHAQPAIYLNSDGNGKFLEAKGRLPFPLEDIDFGAFTSCEFVDVNNDKAPDLILGDAGDELTGGRDSYVLKNNGSGKFTFLENSIPKKPWSDSDVVLDIKSSDINSDGYQDLIFLYTRTEYRGWYIQVLINNSNGTFRDETDERLTIPTRDEPWLSRVEFLDIDSDGDLDLVAFPSFGNKNSFLFLNDGNGFFSHKHDFFEIRAENFTFIDINQDGFLDMVWGMNYPEYAIFVNTSLGCPPIMD